MWGGKKHGTVLVVAVLLLLLAEPHLAAVSANSAFPPNSDASGMSRGQILRDAALRFLSTRQRNLPDQQQPQTTTTIPQQQPPPPLEPAPATTTTTTTNLTTTTTTTTTTSDDSNKGITTTAATTSNKRPTISTLLSRLLRTTTAAVDMASTQTNDENWGAKTMLVLSAMTLVAPHRIFVTGLAPTVKNREIVLSLLALILCFVAAVGNWIGRSPAGVLASGDTVQGFPFALCILVALFIVPFMERLRYEEGWADTGPMQLFSKIRVGLATAAALFTVIALLIGPAVEPYTHKTASCLVLLLSMAVGVFVILDIRSRGTRRNPNPKELKLGVPYLLVLIMGSLGITGVVLSYLPDFEHTSGILQSLAFLTYFCLLFNVDFQDITKGGKELTAEEKEIIRKLLDTEENFSLTCTDIIVNSAGQLCQSVQLGDEDVLEAYSLFYSPDQDKAEQYARNSKALNHYFSVDVTNSPSSLEMVENAGGYKQAVFQRKVTDVGLNDGWVVLHKKTSSLLTAVAASSDNEKVMLAVSLVDDFNQARETKVKVTYTTSADHDANVVLLAE